MSAQYENILDTIQWEEEKILRVTINSEEEKNLLLIH